MDILRRWFGKKGAEPKGGHEPSLFEPRMPEVHEPPDIESVFDKARKMARGEIRNQAPGVHPDQRHVIVVTPGRMLMFQQCPAPGSMSEHAVAGIMRFMPPEPKKNIAVIGYTQLEAVTADVTKAIPFLGMLMGLGYIGHAVWVFEGYRSALAAGCREADVLIVDSGVLPFLQEDWPVVAAGAMRSEKIYVHNRSTFSLGKVVRTK